MLIKLWNWDKNWTCQQVFEGHTHYVMEVRINPKDNNTFASASLDKTVKVCSSTGPGCSMLIVESDPLFRYGSLDPRPPTSPWRATTRV